MAMMNRRIVLQSRPTGLPVAENFRVEEVPLPDLEEGQVLLENRIFAIDPAVRGMLDDVKSYLPPVQIGGLIPTMVLGRVVAMHVRDDCVLDAARCYIDTPKLDLIGRMHGGGWYARTTDLYEQPRIPLGDWPLKG